MNREIKFRVWDMVDYMSNPFTLNDCISRKIVFPTGLPVMQFTGLLDTNGKEIYEKDKVSGRYMVQRSLNPYEEPEIVYFEGIINFSEGCFYVKGSDGQCAFSFNYTDYELEVVGNEFQVGV